MALEQLAGLKIYPNSEVELNGTLYFLAKDVRGKWLGILGDATGFEGLRQGDLLLCPLTAANAAALRARLPWLWPQPLGLRKSVGYGDRLGLATPGHVRATRRFDLAPVFAQQSVRENTRTGRSPQQVLDDAMWGVFQEGWRNPWGADADHLKAIADLDAYLAAGYTLYTVDPGSYVDDEAHIAPPTKVKAKVRALPWEALEDTEQDMERRYLGHVFDLGRLALSFDRETLWRAAAKYGHAIAHTASMYRYLLTTFPRLLTRPAQRGQEAEGRFELEISVDETETPTSPQEHFFIASELRRLGVHWISLALRYVGRFEKGVDYLGDLGEFEAEFSRHVAVAQALGPYKLSLHSGSDKFSLYPYIARHAGELVHVKTAGTSYLAALRSIANVAPGLFRQILRLACLRYPEDKASYHVSADPARLPRLEALADSELASVLELFDGRQVLHVTFGSVLDQFGEELKDVLTNHEETYYAILEEHFIKHLAPFAGR
ncbi:MAG: tagaturonate epimerase family protein [Anaerolineae bacterium]|nr:tagaturonate epimerase family protein [Anaerolineae bacterium]MDW8099000.1 tagaturonate epimerase family protein [Anaerolineae bacterium]